jgi:hypothetical protein
MITLPLEFKDGSGGYSQAPGPLNYKQVARKDNIAVYQRFYIDGRPKDFETVVIKVVPKGTVIFKAPPSLDDEERYPSTGQWGKLGFSYRNQDAATEKMETLLASGNFEETSEEEQAEMNVVVDGIGYFTVKQYAENNKLTYIDASVEIKKKVEGGSIKFVGEKRLNPKGKASKIFSPVKN